MCDMFTGLFAYAQIESVGNAYYGEHGARNIENMRMFWEYLFIEVSNCSKCFAVVSHTEGVGGFFGLIEHDRMCRLCYV